MSLLEDIPEEAISPVLALVKAILRLVMAKDAPEREQALMQAQEDLKAELDKAKFGP